MAGEIIRQGDPTSHGGHVLEGSLTDLCFAKPIAFMGHKTYCPKCKGTFPIVEGAGTVTFYGHGVALAGMKTACGAALIATQFSDVVEYGLVPPRADTLKYAQVTPPAPFDEETTLLAQNREVVRDEVIAESPYDLIFRAHDYDTGQALAHARYRITLDDGRILIGVTDASGTTERVYSHHPQNATIEIPYYDYDDDATDTHHESHACDC